MQFKLFTRIFEVEVAEALLFSSNQLLCEKDGLGTFACWQADQLSFAVGAKPEVAARTKTGSAVHRIGIGSNRAAVS
jgi:hypothetical protein